MKNITLLFSFLISLNSVNAQKIEGTELGLDGTFSAATNGGTAGIGAKYGLKFGESIILGPSLRYQRSWSKVVVTGQKSGFNVFGGGVFLHARLYDYFFLGTEIELLRSPYTNNGFFTNNPRWVATCLLGGGFSVNLNEKIRLNAGVMYDILDIPDPTPTPNGTMNPNPNSPLQPYLTKKANGTIIPMIYRITFFFPLS
ncbi:MAG: hypothetical protein JKY09_00440 [Crocinitomicaceae bacterium]|nr:hypothetical protein [Crocinitomicaceae bacterium]